MRLRPIDEARERPAPAAYEGTDAAGSSLRRSFDGLSVVVAVKPDCDGCRDFLEGRVEIPGVDLHVVAALAHPQISRFSHVVVAPQLWEDLEIPSAPYFVVLDPSVGRVVGEGSVFSGAQVADEVARQLRR